MSRKWQSLLFDTSEAGVSSAVAPELLPPNQNAWMLNGQNRGGKPSTRPNIKWVLDLPDGLMQGCEFFGVQGGMLVASIDGRMYRIRISGSTFSYEEITLSFVNSPVIKQVWMTQTVKTLVIQDGQSNAILYDGSTAVRAVSGEVPRGRQMAYGNGRLWVAVNANEVVAGDIRTGVPGSELLFTEATYLTGGGKLFFPSDITGMAFIPVTGQSDYGALLVFSADETNAIRADITSRDDWGKIPGFVTGILRSVGAISQWSVASVNQDLYWRDSNRGIRSIRNALADESGPGSSPLSREVSRLTDFDSQRQLAFCSSIYHDNRLLMTSSPFLLNNGGVGFKNLIALDFAPLSTMGGKTQAAYDGQWSGLTFTKLVAGKFRGRNRGFAISTDENGRNQLWELGAGDRDDLGSICVDGTADVEPERIKCFVEYPQRDFGVPKIRKRLERCDVWLSEVNGEVDIQVYWRPDNSQKWLLWDEADTCAQTSDPSTDAPHVWKNLRTQYRPQFKTFTIPDDIEEVVKYSAQVGFEFQIRLVWTGRCKIDRVMVHGTVLDDPDCADRAGFSETCVENDVSGNEIVYTLPSTGCSECPVVTLQPENVTVDGGEDALFSVDNSGTATSYQWQVSENGGSSWANITDGSPYSGATTSSLLVSPADGSMSGFLYRCIIGGDGCLNATSGSAELTVNCQAITNQPDPVFVFTDGTASFAVEASLTGNTYQWQVSTNGGAAWANVSNGTPYSGATTATLAIDPAALAMTGYLYRCVVSHASCDDAISDPAELTVEDPSLMASYLLVGGGGGGGYRYGGGGGGGAVTEGSMELLFANTYPVVVGAGGVGGGSVGPLYRGTNGDDSTFNGATAKGGGGGGGAGDIVAGTQSGLSGGPGGGGGGGPTAGVQGGTGGGGSPGGDGGFGWWNGGDFITGGGGGGAVGDGDPASIDGVHGGDGGDGLQSSITGTPTYYGGGGGGNGPNLFGVPGGTNGSGGLGGGGDGGLAGGGTTQGQAGAANLGGGGGGSGPSGAGNPGGSGGSGKVVIRYAGSPRWTGGTIYSDAGDTVHVFNSSGTLAAI